MLDRATVVAGRYRIDDCLAWGGMGVVYAATHVDLGHRFALKFLRPDLAGDVEASERFLDEARMAASFRSEHVARVLDYGHHEGLPYMVVELLEGLDLWTVIDERGPLPIQEAVDYIAQACAGLAEVHAAEIVHRDLKPENLFVARSATGKTRVKLLDFGVSKRIDSGRRLTKPRKGVGSPLYMSPEQMRAQPIDGRADVWALGTVLYELLTGKLPFDAETVPEICNRVLRVAPRPPKQLRRELPAELEAVILRCLEKDRNRRYADVAELAVALADFGTRDAAEAAEAASRILGRELVVAPVAALRKPRRAAHQGRRALAAAAAAAAMIGALAMNAPRAARADAQLAPPDRALESRVDPPLLRLSSASAIPEEERRVPVVHYVVQRAERVAQRTPTLGAQQVSLESEPAAEAPPAPSGECPVPPEPAERKTQPAAPETIDETPAVRAEPTAPRLPAPPARAGAWQI